MNKKNTLWFMGPLYPREEEAAILVSNRGTLSAAPNLFQWNLIDGLQAALGQELPIINALPVGTWPNHYRRLRLPNRIWQNGQALCHEAGCLNLPFIKQWLRIVNTARIVRRNIRPGDEVLLYSTYMPFLQALRRLPKSARLTLIVTDLPEFYDLQKTSLLRKCLRAWQNRIIHRCLKRVDRFVLLTQPMKEPLHVGQRPWLLMEGLYQTAAPAPCSESTKPAILYTGTLHYQFGIQNLLDAFEMLPQKDAELWICGSGEAENAIRALAETDARVKFFGFCPQQQVAQLRQEAAVLVNPRTNDGAYIRYSFPSKTMEYMASGKPVVMCRLDGIPAEYDPYLFYAKDDSAASLANALAHVLEHPQEAALRAKEAQAFVLENKNALKQAQRLVQFIQENP